MGKSGDLKALLKVGGHGIEALRQDGARDWGAATRGPKRGHERQPEDCWLSGQLSVQQHIVIQLTTHHSGFYNLRHLKSSIPS
jgi:hypothetical protein